MLGNCRGSNFYPSKFSTAFAAAACAVLISSCTTSLSLSECEYTDWYAKGLVDGENGATMDQFSVYEKECSRFAISPDKEEYSVGREKGLESYCTRARGYEMGWSGHEYKSVCLESLESDFRAGYEPGKRLHNAEYDVKSINSSISKLKAKIADLEREIGRLDLRLVNSSDEQDRWELEREFRRSQRVLGASKFELMELLQEYIEVRTTYRETVRDVKDLGFAVVEKY